MRVRKRRLWTSLVQVAVTSCLVASVTALPEVIKVGGLFETGDEEEEIAFRYAVHRINADSSILPNSQLSAQVKKVPQHDSFHASKTVCDLLENGVAAIFGPTSPSTSGLVQSTCDTFQIPHLETRWDFRPPPHDHSINLYPHPANLSKAYFDLVMSKNWKSFTIIYEENAGLIKLQDVLKTPTFRDVKVSLRQLVPGQSYKKMMKDLRNQGETNFVLDLPLDKVQNVLREANEVRMMTAYNSYLLTSLDLHTVDWQPFQKTLTNITGFRLIDPANDEVAKAVKDWVQGELTFGRGVENKVSLKTEAALLFDAVKLFAKALQDLDRSQTIQILSLSCRLPQFWPFGNSIVNYMKMIHLHGLSGEITFDEKGQRTNFSLDILKLTSTGLNKIGTWNLSSGVSYSKTYRIDFGDVAHLFTNRTLRVTTIVNSPYTMLREPQEKYRGNDRYEGFCVDLVHELSKIYNFSYEINLVKDGSYGSKNEQGDWNGMIGELINREADMAVADLTVTFNREDAVDFTMPFMNLGIAILFKKPNKKDPALFSFLAPLSLEVWLYMATAYLGVSLFLFILARFSPFEWVNPHPCEQEAEELENQFSLLNSFWFTIGSLMQQGSDLAPRAISTRIVASIWWFFTLIMISSYTANLAAFLTAERMTSPIESAEDLAKQSSISYGCVKSGSTKDFFKNSNIPTYKRMWTFMESAQPSVFAESNNKGVERVRKGNYAFLMESTTIEYITERNCDLTQIGGLLDTKGYGIATPPNSPYRVFLSNAILKLQEEGVVHLLKERWWKVRGADRCPVDVKSSGSASEMSVANVGGVFLVLLIGLGLACFIVILEFIWKAKKQLDRDPIIVMMYREIKSILSCRGSTRPVPKETDTNPSLEKFRMTPLRSLEEDRSVEPYS